MQSRSEGTTGLSSSYSIRGDSGVYSGNGEQASHLQYSRDSYTLTTYKQETITEDSNKTRVSRQKTAEVLRVGMVAVRPKS